MERLSAILYRAYERDIRRGKTGFFQVHAAQFTIRIDYGCIAESARKVTKKAWPMEQVCHKRLCARDHHKPVMAILSDKLELNLQSMPPAWLV